MATSPCLLDWEECGSLFSKLFLGCHNILFFMSPVLYPYFSFRWLRMHYLLSLVQDVEGNNDEQ